MANQLLTLAGWQDSQQQLVWSAASIRLMPRCCEAGYLVVVQ